MPAPSAVPSGRDLRLDLFRGLALWVIFLDHIPNNIVSWITIRHYGFSDATEIFVFVSGYTAAFVYGREMRSRGPLIGGARILRRAWQVYVAHIFLFVLYMTEIAYVTSTFQNPLYNEEMGILDFLKQPDSTLVQAMLLRFQPANMDILPLYIVLLLGFPPTLWLLLRRPALALGASVALYTVSHAFGLKLHTWPQGTWFFNPLAWQLLFVFGAWCALGGAEKLGPFLRSRQALVLAIGYLVFGFAISFIWNVTWVDAHTPKLLYEWVFSIDKSNLDLPRFFHFLALATITVRFVRPDSPWLASPWVWPVIMCGQYSLVVFCLGEFLSLAAHFIIVEVSGGYDVQLMVSVGGILIMIAVAQLATWYKRIERSTRGPREAPVGADFAEG